MTDTIDIVFSPLECAVLRMRREEERQMTSDQTPYESTWKIRVQRTKERPMTTKADKWARDKREAFGRVASDKKGIESQKRPSFEFPGGMPGRPVPGLTVSDDGDVHLEPPMSVFKMHGPTFVLKMIAWLTEWYGPAEGEVVVKLKTDPDIMKIGPCQRCQKVYHIHTMGFLDGKYACGPCLSKKLEAVSGDPRDDMPVDIHGCTRCGGVGCDTCCKFDKDHPRPPGALPAVELEEAIQDPTASDQLDELRDSVFRACAGIIPTPEKASSNHGWMPSGLRELRSLAEDAITLKTPKDPIDHAALAQYIYKWARRATKSTSGIQDEANLSWLQRTLENGAPLAGSTDFSEAEPGPVVDPPAVEPSGDLSPEFLIKELREHQRALWEACRWILCGKLPIGHPTNAEAIHDALMAVGAGTDGYPDISDAPSIHGREPSEKPAVELVKTPEPSPPKRPTTLQCGLSMGGGLDEQARWFLEQITDRMLDEEPIEPLILRILRERDAFMATQK